MGENGPSERAREAAYPRLLGWASVSEEGLRLIIDRVGEATHDPALGSDRSVNVRALRDQFPESQRWRIDEALGRLDESGS